MAEADAEKERKWIFCFQWKRPSQMALINVKAHIEEKYRLAGYNEEKIKNDEYKNRFHR